MLIETLTMITMEINYYLLATSLNRIRTLTCTYEVFIHFELIPGVNKNYLVDVISGHFPVNPSAA